MSLATESVTPRESVPAAEDSETALVHAAKEGDMSAFEQLLRRTQAPVFRVAQHITGSREDAEEVTQEAFLKAFQNLQRFEERSRFSTWVTRIAVNTALMRLRRRRGHETVPIRNEDGQAPGLLPEKVVDWRPNPEQLYSRRELREILARALAELPQHYSTVFLLRDVEGFSTADTAEALGLSVATVKIRLLRARLQLRERLSSYFCR
jgi:RNA polymerase sigma-70 factor (ECF subfamily)